MNGIIWLWKHRYCWKQLKYLYENRYSLKLILEKVSLHPDAPEKIERILASLREFDRVPPPGPRYAGYIELGTDGLHKPHRSFDNMRIHTPPTVSGKVEPPYPWSKRNMSRPKQRDAQ